MASSSKTVLIVFAHQSHKSFNGALLRTARETLENQGHTVLVSDLYEMDFEARTRKQDITGNGNITLKKQILLNNRLISTDDTVLSSTAKYIISDFLIVT